MKNKTSMLERIERDLSIQKAAKEARNASGKYLNPIQRMIYSTDKEVECCTDEQGGQLDDNLVTVNIEVDADVYNQCTELFKRYGMTVEKIALAVLEFCVMPENESIIAAYLKEDVTEELKQKVFDSVYAIAAKID